MSGGHGELPVAARVRRLEERLIAAANCCKDETSTEILKRLFAEADAFTAGAPQHDDMTLLVVTIG